MTCSQCNNLLCLPVGQAATLTCQLCGCPSGTVSMMEEGNGKTVGFSCSMCGEEFFLFRNTPSNLGCPKCGNLVIIPRVLSFSKITRDPSFGYGFPEPDIDSNESLPSARIKIVIPYYGGNGRIDQAVKTWIIPEVVWAITDEQTVPPGWGVCHQIFTPKNAVSEKLHPKKTKPFLIDILKRVVEKFPDEQFYGFFNSDIILPPGVSVRYLVPSEGKDVVFYHRKDLISEKKIENLRDVKICSIQCCGKDGFVASKKAIQTIIEKMPDLVIGAPVWDDGLALWCWKNLGKEKIEFRYGDVWHVLHPLEWSVYEPDAEFNAKQIISSGIQRHEWHEINWEKVQDQEMRENPLKGKRVLGIVQPGRIGDIIIVLPIAKWFYEVGYKVVWPVHEEFLPLFDYVNYVEAIGVRGNLADAYRKSLMTLQDMKVSRVLDLGIGFGRNEHDWITSKLNFNEWKYKEAGVPFKERFELQINRDLKKEYALWEFVKNSHKLNGDRYSVIHDEGTKGPFKFQESGVRIFPKEGFTVFDWIGIIEKAKHLYCVDSCVTNLADQLKLCVGNRTVWFWQDIPDVEPRKALGFPKLCKDWRVI